MQIFTKATVVGATISLSCLLSSAAFSGGLLGGGGVSVNVGSGGSEPLVSVNVGGSDGEGSLASVNVGGPGEEGSLASVNVGGPDGVNVSTGPGGVDVTGGGGDDVLENETGSTPATRQASIDPNNSSNRAARFTGFENALLISKDNVVLGEVYDARTTSDGKVNMIRFHLADWAVNGQKRTAAMRVNLKAEERDMIRVNMTKQEFMQQVAR